MDIVKPYVYSHESQHQSRREFGFDEEPDYIDDDTFKQQKERLQMQRQVVDDQKAFLKERDMQISQIQNSQKRSSPNPVHGAASSAATDTNAQYVWNDEENRYVPGRGSDTHSTSPAARGHSSNTFADIVSAMAQQTNSVSPAPDQSEPDGVIPFDFLVNFDNGSVARQVTKKTHNWLKDARARIALRREPEQPKFQSLHDSSDSPSPTASLPGQLIEEDSGVPRETSIPPHNGGAHDSGNLDEYGGEMDGRNGDQRVGGF